MARTVIMMQTILERPEVMAHADRLDLNRDFVEKFGLPLVSYCNVVFGFIAHAVELAESVEAAKDADVVVRARWFDRVNLDPSAVRRILDHLACGPDELRAQFVGIDLSTDFSPVQRKPLLRVDGGGHICLDYTYLFEKSGKAFFWILRDMYDNDTGARLMRFWGRSYHTWIWEQQYQGTGQFLPSPRYSGATEREIADAVLLEDDALVLFECKASVVTTKAKYSFDGSQLGKEIQKKFVEDPTEKKRRKGVGQLAAAIGNISGADRQTLPFTMNKIKRIYSVLVTLDPIIEAPDIREYLNGRFIEMRSGVKSIETITPLFAVHIADLERLLRFTNTRPFIDILREFTRGHPEAKHFPGPIADYMEELYRHRGVKHGRDVVGEKIKQVLTECGGMFTVSGPLE